MEKKITDKLITDKLEAKGYLEYHDMDETKAWNLLEKHYDCEVSDSGVINTLIFIAILKQPQTVTKCSSLQTTLTVCV